MQELPAPWQLNEKALEGLNPEARQALINFEVYQRNMAIMAQISAQMKEVPILPSEIPPENDRNALQRVEFPEEGGVLTYMEGYELPYRGFPLAEIVEKIDVMKKLAKASLSGLYHALKDRRLMLIVLFPAIFVFRDLIYSGVYTFYRLIERFKLKSVRMSRCMRELHRAFSADRPREGEKMTTLRTMLRDVICNVLEFDNAYRFRAQDIFAEIDSIALKRSPVKELTRLLTLMQSRETTQEIRDTWKLARMFVSLYLRFDRKLLRMIVDVLSSINIEQFKLTPEDIQFCVKRKDYVFGCMQ